MKKPDLESPFSKEFPELFKNNLDDSAFRANSTLWSNLAAFMNIELEAAVADRISTTPDSVDEARQECTITFLENVLIPLFSKSTDISIDKIIKLAKKHKKIFKANHPKEYVKYELLNAVQQMILNYRIARPPGEAATPELTAILRIYDYFAKLSRADIDRSWNI